MQTESDTEFALMREGMRIKSHLARPLDHDWSFRRARWDCHYPDADAYAFQKIILQGPRHPYRSALRAAVEGTIAGVVRRPSSGHGRETVIGIELNPPKS